MQGGLCTGREKPFGLVGRQTSSIPEFLGTQGWGAWCSQAGRKQGAAAWPQKHQAQGPEPWRAGQ